jgi:hypothetical protein
MKNRSKYHSPRFSQKIQVQSVQNNNQSIQLNQEKTYNNFEQLSASKSNVINKKQSKNSFSRRSQAFSHEVQPLMSPKMVNRWSITMSTQDTTLEMLQLRK